MKVKCPFCSSKKIKFLRDLKSSINNKNYEHRLCNNCGLEFFTPLIFENIYETEIHGAYGSHHEGKKSYLEWTKQLVKTLKKLKLDYKNLQILDIGAGDCINFRALNEKFGVTAKNYSALEFDSKSCKVCKRRGVKNIINKPFNKCVLRQFKGKKYDLIISTEVIEHMVDLKEYIGTLIFLLNKGGIAVLTTPNKGRVFIRQREHIGGDVPPNHFLRFDKYFFRKNLRKNLIYAKDYPFNNIKGMSIGLSLKFLKNGFWYPFFPISIVFRIVSYFKGDGVVIVLKK